MRTTMVRAGRHRIEANIAGDGSPVVVIEPSFGGSAAEWRSIAETLAAETTVVTYDRAPYGASSRAADRRTPADIAGDLHAVLQALGIAGPVVLVGFSVGGMYVRAYAALHPDQVAGMVLVESSHEGQTPLLNEVFTWKVKLEELLFQPKVLLLPAELARRRRPPVDAARMAGLPPPDLGRPPARARRAGRQAAAGAHPRGRRPLRRQAMAVVARLPLRAGEALRQQPPRPVRPRRSRAQRERSRPGDRRHQGGRAVRPHGRLAARRRRQRRRGRQQRRPAAAATRCATARRFAT